MLDIIVLVVFRTLGCPPSLAKTSCEGLLKFPMHIGKTTTTVFVA